MARTDFKVIFADVGRGDRRLTQVLAALLLVALLACLAIWAVTGLKAVPDVVGMTKVEAEEALKGAGLALGAVDTRSATAAEDGRVVEQRPVAGDRVLAGSAVSLFVGKAPGAVVSGEGGAGPGGKKAEAIPVPPWSGNPPREETIVPYDAAALPSGVRVPSVMGMSSSSALSTLSGAGFAGSVRTGKSTTDVPAGTVFAQRPSAESYVPSGSTVVIWVSTGPPIGGSPYPKAPYTN